jgi:hypothetical protein
MATGDMDDDGRLDLFATNANGLGVNVWRNTSSRKPWYGWTDGLNPGSGTVWADAMQVPGGLAAATVVSNCVGLWSGDGLTWNTQSPLPCADDGLLRLVSADLNHDGKWDLVAATEAKGLRAWVQGTAWTAYGSGLPTTGSYTALALGDVNRDGQVDVVAAGPGLGVRAWYGSKTGAWTSASSGLPSSGDFWDIALADMDNNGLLEVLASSQNGLGIRTYRWYAPMNNWQACGPPWLGNYYGLDVGDINDDGKLDIAAARSGMLGVEMYLGDGACGVISTTTPFPVPVAMYSRDVALGDINRDGKLDLASVGTDPVLHLARLSFWLGDGGRTWSAASPTSAAVDAERVFIGPLNSDGLLDLLYVNTSGTIRPWLAGDFAPPGLWFPFGPTGWVSATQSPSCNTSVADSQSGLDVSTAQYSYTKDGGAQWSDWLNAICSGTDATTSTQQMTTPPIPFGESASANVIRYRLCDMAGNCGTSPDRTVRIDTVPPTSTLTFGYSDSPDTWTNDATIEIYWTPPLDEVSGVAGYCTVWKQKEAAPTNPPAVNTTMSSTVSPPLADANNWYFFLQSVDAAGNWSLPASRGPFKIDTVPPANPSSWTANPLPGSWSRATQLSVDWPTEDPPGGSPLLGWEYGWSHSPTQMPAEPAFTLFSSTPPFNADEAPDWYLHLRTWDQAENVSVDTLHIGPFMLDQTAPTNPSRLWSNSHTPAVWSSDNTVSASWSGAGDTGGSGAAGFAVSWSHNAAGWPPLSVSTGDTTITSPELDDGNDLWMHLATSDQAGNWSSQAVHLGPFYIDTHAPVPWIRAVPISGGAAFSLTWGADDAGAGLATSGTFDVQYRIDTGNWLPSRTGTATTSTTWTNIESGKTYSFRARAKDKLDHWSDWSAPVILAFVEVRVVDAQGKAVGGAEVWADDEECGLSDSQGMVHGYFAAGTRLTARKVVEVFASTKGQHKWDLGYDWAYRVYITSVPIQPDGTPVVYELPASTAAVTLEVSPDNALFGFNVVATPWWDATDDELAVLEANLREASRYFYDATDGQMFFEHILLIDNAEAVDEADIRFALDLNYRAWAEINGIHNPAYHIYLERYDVGSTMIHEWGHYGLDLNDEYIDVNGIEGAGKCTAKRDILPLDESSSIMDQQTKTTEFCSPLAANPHEHNTQQQENRHMSCWEWIVQGYDDAKGRWRIWMPSDVGQIRPGPTDLAVPGWMSVEVIRADTGVCAPTDMTFVDTKGKAIANPVVWLYQASGFVPLEEGTGDFWGSLLVSGIHDGDALEVQDTNGNVLVTKTVRCTPGGPATLAVDASAVQAQSVSPDFRVTVGSSPIAGARALWLWSRANGELAAPPVARVWQYGRAAFTVTLGYSPTLDLYIGRAALDTEQPMAGTVAVWARSTEGEVARMSSPFRVQAVDAQSNEYAISLDGRARLYLPADALDQDSAISIVPGAYLGRPAGLEPLSRPYHIGVSPASPELHGTGVLTFYLDESRMSQVASGTAQMYRWEQETQTWLPAGGAFYSERTLVSGRIERLGTYAVLGRPMGAVRVYLPALLR